MATDDTSKAPDDAAKEKGDIASRENIARNITRFSIYGTIGIGLITLVYIFLVKAEHGITAEDDLKFLDKKIQVIQYVFTALLPLWGTWMGTVIAFYFSKANFQAANEGVKKLFEQMSPAQKLESTKCKDVMIPFEKIKPFPLTSTAPVEDNAADEAQEAAKASDEALTNAKAAADQAKQDADTATSNVAVAAAAKTAADAALDDPAIKADPDALAAAKTAAADAATALDAANAAAATAATAVTEANAAVVTAEAAKTAADSTAAEKTAAAATANTKPLDQLASIKILDAIAFMKENKITRLPLFNGKKLLYIIHQSTFEKFITEITTTATLNIPIPNATINDMVTNGSDDVKGYLLNGAQYIDINANLRQAQALVEKNAYCQDVFLTTNGNASEDVIGWVTNNKIAENAKDLKSGS
jgi:chemotaxis protein histidine kinase CheA